MARLEKEKVIGLGAVVVVSAGWAWASSDRGISTDNAYARADLTSLAPKVAGYVTPVLIALKIGLSRYAKARRRLSFLD